MDNLFADIPQTALNSELLQTLVSSGNLRIERIVSTGQASPPGVWYDQQEHEWVVLLSGAAGLLLEGEAAPREMRPGDHLHLPAHCRHRVEWTAQGQATVWLAVFWR